MHRPLATKGKAKGEKPSTSAKRPSDFVDHWLPLDEPKPGIKLSFEMTLLLTMVRFRLNKKELTNEGSFTLGPISY